MNEKREMAVILVAVLLTPVSLCMGVIIGWCWFNYDFHHHPDWHIMNPEDGGFGQLGAIVTYCGIGALAGLVVGLVMSLGIWNWALRHFAGKLNFDYR